MNDPRSLASKIDQALISDVSILDDNISKFNRDIVYLQFMKLLD